MPEYVLRTMGTAVKVDLPDTRGAGPLRGLPVLKKGERIDFGIRLARPYPGARSRRAAGDGPGTGIVKRLPRGVFRAVFDPEERMADCSFSGGISPRFALALGVNYAFQAFQEELDIFFFHAASIVIGEKAYLFPAPSGGGKSTISRLAGGEGIKVLGDDTCVVKRKGRKFFVSAYPLSTAPGGEEHAWKVDSVFFLNKAGKNRVKDMTLSEAVRKAMPEAMCYFAKGMVPMHRPEYSRYVFRSLCSMLENVRFGALYFAKNREVFSCLG